MARTNWKREYELLAAKYKLLGTQYDILEGHVLAKHTKAPATAAVVYVDGKPFFTAFVHSTAYRMMNTIKDRGHKAMYRPLGA